MVGAAVDPAVRVVDHGELIEASLAIGSVHGLLEDLVRAVVGARRPSRENLMRVLLLLLLLLWTAVMPVAAYDDNSSRVCCSETGKVMLLSKDGASPGCYGTGQQHGC